MTDPKTDEDSECACEECAGACVSKPGWFAPGEVELVAEHLDVPLERLFREKIGVDWWEADGEIPETFGFAPATTANPAGTEYPADPRGRCVFLVEGRCSIHAVKPEECRQAHRSHPPEAATARRFGLAKRWQEHQGQVIDLLGREPISARYGLFEAMMWGLG